MATNGSGPTGAFAPVLNAMSTMRVGQREQKKAAHQYLESFQKSVGLQKGCCAIGGGIMRLTDFAGGSMADYHRHLGLPSRPRGQVVRGYDIEGKGRYIWGAIGEEQAKDIDHL